MSNVEKEQIQIPKSGSGWFSEPGVKFLAGYRIWIVAAVWLCVRGYTLWGLTPNVFVENFFKLAGDWLDGYTPYSDFQVTHPPGALLLFVMPIIFTGTPVSYGYGFAFLMLLADAGLLLLLPRISALVTSGGTNEDIYRRCQDTLVCLAYILFTAVFGRLFFQAYDLLLALLLAAAIYFALRGKTVAVDVLAAVAIWLNPTALIWLPLLWWYGSVSGDDRSTSQDSPGAVALMGVLGRRVPVLAGCLLVLYGPFFLMSGRSLASAMTAGFTGGLQLESTAASILMLTSRVFDFEVASEFTRQAMHLNGWPGSGVAVVCTAVSIIVLVVVTVFMGRRLSLKADGASRALWLVIGLFVTNLALLSTSRVFLIQSLVWMCPLAAVLTRDERREISSRGWHLFGINVLSAVIFFFFYPNLIELEILPALLLLIRNLAVIWLAVSILQLPAGGGQVREPLIRLTDRTRRYLLYLPVVLLFVWGTAAAFRPVRNADIWMLMREGADIIATGEIPQVDSYSAVADGRPYIAHEWLSGIFFHGIFTLGGGQALTVFRALSMLAMLLLLWFSLAKRARRFILAPLLIALAAYVILERVFVRPHIFTMIFLCVWVFALEHWRQRRQLRYLIILVPMQIIWANLHGGYIMGLILGTMMTGATAFLVLVPSWSRDESYTWADVRVFALLTVACLIASLINPHGIGLIKFSLNLGLASDYIKQYVYEWGSPFAARYRLRAYGSDIALALFILIWLGLAISARRRPLVDALIALLGTLMTAQAVRFISFIGLLGFTVAVRAWLSIADAYLGPVITRRRPLAESALFALIIASTLVYGFAYDKTNHRRIGWGFGGKLPVETVSFLAESGFEGNIFNDYTDGAYLQHHLAPRILPVMDGRIDVYGSELAHEYFSSRDDPIKFFRYLNKYNVSLILLMQTKKNIKVIQLLSQLPAARLLLRADDRFLFAYNPDLLPPQLKQELAQ